MKDDASANSLCWHKRALSTTYSTKGQNKTKNLLDIYINPKLHLTRDNWICTQFLCFKNSSSTFLTLNLTFMTNMEKAHFPTHYESNSEQVNKSWTINADRRCGANNSSRCRAEEAARRHGRPG